MRLDRHFRFKTFFEDAEFYNSKSWTKYNMSYAGLYLPTIALERTTYRNHIEPEIFHTGCEYSASWFAV